MDDLCGCGAGACLAFAWNDVGRWNFCGPAAAFTRPASAAAVLPFSPAAVDGRGGGTLGDRAARGGRMEGDIGPTEEKADEVEAGEAEERTEADDEEGDRKAANAFTGDPREAAVSEKGSGRAEFSFPFGEGLVFLGDGVSAGRACREQFKPADGARAMERLDWGVHSAGRRPDIGVFGDRNREEHNRRGRRPQLSRSE